jgi:HNH endonuclease
MIRLVKAETPPILRERKEEWTAEFLRYHRADARHVPNAVRFRYRDKTIKAALLAEASGKCVYCESRMLHVDSGETDHIVPISVRPEMIFEWENMAFACHECNRAKGAFYDPTMRIINPFSEDPDEFFEHHGPMVCGRLGNGRADVSVEKLNLRRPALILRKYEFLRNLKRSVEMWAEAIPGVRRDILREELMGRVQPLAEHSACATWFVRSHLGDMRAEFFGSPR